MKLSTDKSKIVGLRLGELEVNMLGEHMTVKAHFALLREDGSTVGKVTRSSWGAKTHAALAALADTMEEEMLGEVFEIPELPTPEETQQY